MTHVIPVGTSEPQDFQLQNDGAAIDGTGFTVELEIYRATGRTPTDIGSPRPTVAWLDQDAGTVRVTGCEALEEGQYLVRYKLTDAEERDGFFPNGAQADVWSVVPVGAR